MKIGDTVRLKRSYKQEPGRRQVAVIQEFYSDIQGGVRLDRRLENHWSWNVKHLEIVKPRKRVRRVNTRRLTP